MTPPADIKIAPATREDLAALTDVFAASFQPRRPFPILVPGVTHDDLVKFMYVRQEDPTEDQFSYKAIDTNTDQIVGWMQWKRHAQVYPPSSISEKWLPENTNVPLMNHFFDTMNGNLFKMGESIGGGPYHELKLMCVRPEYERQGIAGTMLEIGLALADKEELPTIVSASENGAPLYRRHGFEERYSFDIDGENAQAPPYTEAQLFRPARKA